MRKILITLLFLVSFANAEATQEQIDGRSMSCEFLLKDVSSYMNFEMYDIANTYALAYESCMQDAVRLSYDKFRQRWWDFEKTIVYRGLDKSSKQANR